jgi:Spy/CpxP family protein refolding chaperone
MSMAANEKSKTTAVILTAVLVVGAAAFLYHQWRSTHPVIAAPAGTEREFARPERPNRAEMEQRFQEMADRAGVTEEQRQQIEALGPPPSPDATREERRAHFDSVREILTPEQREQMREEMGQRMRERLSRDLERLPEDQRERFLRRLEERMAERGGRGGPGGGRGFPPPPPPEFTDANVRSGIGEAVQ